MTWTDRQEITPRWIYPSYDLALDNWLDASGTEFDSGVHKVNATGIPVVDAGGNFVAIAFGGTVYNDVAITKTAQAGSITVTARTVGGAALPAPTVNEDAIGGIYRVEFTSDTATTIEAAWDVPGANGSPFTTQTDPAAQNRDRFESVVPGGGPLDDPTGPPPAGQCRLWTYAYNKIGEEQAGIPYTLTQRTVTGDDYSSSLEAQTALSGAAIEDDSPAPSVGYVYFLVRNVGAREYILKREGGGDVKFTVPDGAASFQMPATLGEDAD